MLNRLIILLVVIISTKAVAGSVYQQPAQLLNYPLTHSGTFGPLENEAEILFRCDQASPDTVTIYTDDAHHYAATKLDPPPGYEAYRGWIDKERDGTWPSGIDGTEGTGYYFRMEWSDNNELIVDDPGTLVDGITDLSVAVAFNPDRLYWSGPSTLYQIPISKWELDLPSSWMLQMISKTSYNCIKEEAEPHSAICVYLENIFQEKTEYVMVFTVGYRGGTVYLTSYLNGEVIGSNSAVRADWAGIYDTDAHIALGGMGNGPSAFHGMIHQAAVWDRELSAAEVLDLTRRWFGIESRAQTALTISVTDPPAIFSTDRFYNQLDDNLQIGSSGLYVPYAMENSIQRAGFETCTQNSNTEPDGWGVTEGLLSNVYCDAYVGDTDRAVEGYKKLQMDIGLLGSATLETACVTDNIGETVYVSIWGKKVSGNPSCDLSLWEFDDADCSGNATETLFFDEYEPPTSWTKLPTTGRRFAAASWQGDTVSYYLELYCDGTSSIQWDAAGMVASIGDSDAFCGCDSDVLCSCGTATVTAAGPVLDNSSFTIDATVKFPRALNNTESIDSYFYEMDTTTSGEVNRIRVGATDGDSGGLGAFVVGDKSGDEKIIKTDLVLSSDQSHRFVATHFSTGDLLLSIDGTQVTSTTATGTAILDDNTTTIKIGVDNWIKNLIIWNGASK